MWIAGSALVTIAAVRGRPDPVQPGLYYFFSPDTPGLADTARSLRSSDIRVRPVLLITGFGDWPESFTSALSDLGEVSVVDEEGLALARRFGVRRTPCFVRVDSDGLHFASGTKTDFKELLECGKSH